VVCQVNISIPPRIAVTDILNIFILFLIFYPFRQCHENRTGPG